MTSVNASLHVTSKTSISRGLPREQIPGGYITLGEGPIGMDIFGPRDVHEAVDFWRYLANVAGDMATYCEVQEQKGK